MTDKYGDENEHQFHPEEGVYHRDEGKPRVDLLSPIALLGMAEVLSYGVSKYGERNWEEHAEDWSYGQLIGSTIRHIIAFMRREDLDSETKLNHLDHALVNLMMLVTLYKLGKGKDDRSNL